jgi:hypothetical protein
MELETIVDGATKIPKNSLDSIEMGLPGIMHI